jgi:uncharacterized protein YdaU (DUF1376 family)
MTLPYMTIFVTDYHADTEYLTPEERGVYFDLLCAMWKRGGRVPNDDIDLARMTRVGIRKWKRIKARLLPLLSVEKSGELTQPQLLKEANKAKTWSKLQAAKAHLRWENKHLGHAGGYAPIPIPLYSNRDASPSPRNSDASASRKKEKPNKPPTSVLVAGPKGFPEERPESRAEAQLENDLRTQLPAEQYSQILTWLPGDVHQAAITAELRAQGEGARVVLAAFKDVAA